MLHTTAVRCLGLLPTAREAIKDGVTGKTSNITRQGRLGRAANRTGWSTAHACPSHVLFSDEILDAHGVVGVSLPKSQRSCRLR